MAAFDTLSDEGKLAKIRQHLDGSGHPVPAPWVEWLLNRVAPETVPGVSHIPGVVEARYGGEEPLMSWRGTDV